MEEEKDKLKFNPISQDPVTQAYTQGRCLDSMSLIKLFIIAYDKHRYDKSHSGSRYFNFINAMDVFRKECKLHGFTRET